MFKYAYRKNEIVAVYVDENGDRQVVPFDTVEEGMEFISNLRKFGDSVIGVMTTSFYDRYVEHIAEFDMSFTG